MWGFQPTPLPSDQVTLSLLVQECINLWYALKRYSIAFEQKLQTLYIELLNFVIIVLVVFKTFSVGIYSKAGLQSTGDLVTNHQVCRLAGYTNINIEKRLRIYQIASPCKFLMVMKDVGFLTTIKVHLLKKQNNFYFLLRIFPSLSMSSIQYIYIIR